MPTRRDFLGTSALAFLGLQRYAGADSASTIEPFGPLQPDSRGILDLPRGFEYRILSKRGTRMSDGFRVPGVPDDMAAFARDDGKLVLVINHELGLGNAGAAPFPAQRLPDSIDPELCYDPGADGRLPHFGGTTNLVFDPDKGETIDQFLSLVGTDRNCSGGALPWGSWITCEEPADLISERGLRHGWCFEVEATTEPGLQRPQPLRALGRFRHEAVTLDPASGILYLTEDRPDGLLYRFLPEKPRDFTRGRLQALAVSDRPGLDLRNYRPGEDGPRVGETLAVKWIDLDETDAPKDDLRLRGHAAGAARFARGEGIHFSDDGIFVCCTDGGPDRRGQLYRLRPAADPDSSDELELFVQSSRHDLLTNGDNLCPAPWGGLVVCEDLVNNEFAPHTHLRGVTPEGEVYTIARNARDNTEFAGSCFSPDGRWLFANLQGHGLTLAITGPWERA